MFTFECSQCNIAWHAEQHQMVKKYYGPSWVHGGMWVECIKCGSPAVSKLVDYKCQCGREWEGLRYDKGLECDDCNRTVRRTIYIYNIIYIYIYMGQCPAESPFWLVFQVFKFFDFP